MVSLKEKAGFAVEAGTGFLAALVGTEDLGAGLAADTEADVALGFLLAAFREVNNEDGLFVIFIPWDRTGVGADFSPGRVCFVVWCVFLK
jgi:hypothetical protein